MQLWCVLRKISGCLGPPNVIIICSHAHLLDLPCLGGIWTDDIWALSKVLDSGCPKACTNIFKLSNHKVSNPASTPLSCQTAQFISCSYTHPSRMWSIHLMCIHKVFMMTPAKDSCKRIIINGKHGTHLAPGKLWKWAYSVLASWEKKHIKCAKNCIYFAHDIDMQGYAVPARRLSSSSSSSHSSHFALLSHFHARKTLISSKTTVATHATHPTYSHLKSVHNTPTTPLTPPAPCTAVSAGVVAKWFLQLVVSLKCSHPLFYLNIFKYTYSNWM